MNVNNEVYNTKKSNNSKDKNYYSLIVEKNRETNKYKKPLDNSSKYNIRKLEINNHINNKKIDQKRQRTTNINFKNNSFNNNNQETFNSYIKNTIENKKKIRYKEHEKMNTKNKSDNLQEIIIINKLYPNRNSENNIINEKNYILNKRINYFRERSIKALGK